MTCRPIARGVLAVCALAFALVLPTAVAAQDQPQKANIVVSVSSTVRDGAVSYHGGSGNEILKVGESKPGYYYTTADGNGFGAGSQPVDSWPTDGVVRTGVVAGGVVASTGSRPPMKYDYSWQVNVKLISVAIDTVTFEIDWKRSDLKDGAAQVTASDRRTITLRQGEKHLLDFIPCTADSRYANTFMDVQASPVEDAAVADLTFAYDLWLVHQTAEGTKINRHAIVTGRQGEKVNFSFASVPLQLDAAAGADADSPYRLYVDGTIAGRLKADGTMEIALQPTRRQRFPTGGGGLGGGTKTFSARVGEATSIALPAGGGFSSWRVTGGSTPAAPRRGVSVTADQIRVDLKPFFEGTNTSILVTVRRDK